MRGVLVGVIAAALLAIGALLLPPITAGSTVPILFAAAALPALALLVAILLISGIAVVLLLGKRRAAAAVTGGLAAVLVIPLAMASGAGTTSDIPAHGAKDELRILSWNTDQKSVSDDLVALVDHTDPDIIVLPEMFTSITGGTITTMAAERDMTIYGWDSAASTVLVTTDSVTTNCVTRTRPRGQGFGSCPSSNPRQP